MLGVGATMRTTALTKLAALTLLTHLACTAGVEETEGVSGSRLSQDDSVGDGLTAEDAVSQESIDAARERVGGFVNVPNLTAAEKQAILARYATVQHDGIRQPLYEDAILYYDTNRERIPNKRWLTVLDFRSHSRNRRFFVLDMDGGTMKSYPVAHGAKSDPDDDGLATSFSNVNGSNKSSVGYYLTAETYIGGNGRSLRLDGLSTTNTNARERLIVVHGADYVADGRPKQGMSLGCPALSHSIAQGVIDQLQAGSLLYAMN